VPTPVLEITGHCNTDIGVAVAGAGRTRCLQLQQDPGVHPEEKEVLGAIINQEFDRSCMD
jgi:hypothetical protein